MEKLPLEAVANQSFSCNLGGQLFNISIQSGKSNSLLLSVQVDNTSVRLVSILCVNKAQMMLPPRNTTVGNLMWLCDDGASYPSYEKLGKEHNLYWWPNE